MKCLIPGSNVKVFGRAIHCLSKIGEDLYLEPLETGLALRTVNSSRSAYACFLFSPNFFITYQHKYPDNTTGSGDQEEGFRCKITIKSCLSVFKSLSNLEKNVDRCQIHLNEKECRLVFQLYCRHGITKTYNLTYQETETLQAVFSRDLCPNHILAETKVLTEITANFQTSQEEVTMTVNPSQLSFKNYVDDEPDPLKVVHSELLLAPEEFENYSIGVDTEVTFCLKELRAILSFSDAVGLPVSIHFETVGKPIVFAVESEQNLEATFVLATLADSPDSQASQRPSQVTAVSQRRRNKSKTKKSNGHVEAVNGGFPDDDDDDGNDDDDVAEIDQQDETNLHIPSTSSPVIPVDPFFQRINKPLERVSSVPAKSKPSDGQRKKTQEDLHERSASLEANKTFFANFSFEDDGDVEDHQLRASPVDEGEDEDFDFIPGTPPSKKLKSMFFATSQMETSQSSKPANPNPSATKSVVLAEDTDEEDSD